MSEKDAKKFLQVFNEETLKLKHKRVGVTEQLGLNGSWCTKWGSE